MAYVPHLLITFGGNLGTTESWSCGVRLTSLGYQTSSPAGRQAHARAILPKLVTAIGTPFQGRSFWPGTALLQRIKCNPIVEVGGKVRYEDPNETNELVANTAWQSGQGSAAPFQCAHVASLRTAARRGIAHVGRIYIPAAGVAILPTGHIDGQVRDDVGTAVGRLVRQLNEAATQADGITTQVSVVSRGVGGAKGNPDPGPWKPVTHIRVGSVIDTQRRRREGIPELYADYRFDGTPITAGDAI